MRYNFIAVDDLIYTNEVIGNMLESYPVLPIFVVIFALTAFASSYIDRNTKSELTSSPNLDQKAILLAYFDEMCAGILYLIPKLDDVKHENIFAVEIQSNGILKYWWALTLNELHYFKFDKTRNLGHEFSRFTMSREITLQAIRILVW